MAKAEWVKVEIEDKEPAKVHKQEVDPTGMVIEELQTVPIPEGPIFLSMISVRPQED